VTNTGDVNLVDVQLADTTTIGDKQVTIKWDAIPPVLAPGAFFTGRGQLVGLEPAEVHGDEVEVKARPQVTPPGCKDVDPDNSDELAAKGCVVGDKDQWHGVGETNPSVDVEKASGAQPPAGDGNMLDKPDNVASDDVKDADTVDTAVKLDPAKESVVYATVTNKGDEALKNLVITDTTAMGVAMKIDAESFRLMAANAAPGTEPTKLAVTVTPSEDGKTQVVTFDEGFVFEVGAAITFSGTLPALGSEANHTDDISVEATGDKSGKPVKDKDPWIATTDPDSIPSVDVEKTSGGHASAGVGNMLDKPNNVTDEKITDADTPETAHVVDPAKETKVYVAVTNNGTEDLTNVVITDETLAGKPVAIDVDSLKLKDSKHANDNISSLDDVKATVAGGVITFNKEFVFEVDAVITFTATLPGLDKDVSHIDKVRVNGTGVKSGVDVLDEDLWHATVKPAEVGTPAISVEKFDLRTLAMAGNDVKDAAFATSYKPDSAADRDSDDKALVFYSAQDAERDRIGVIVTNTGTEDLVDLKISDLTPEGYAGKIVDWRVLQVAGKPPAAGVTWDNLSGVTLKPGETIVFDGALTGMDPAKVHKDTVTVTGKGKESGKKVTDKDDWFAKIATTGKNTDFKEKVPGVIKIVPEKTGVKYAALITLGAGLVVVAAALGLERHARRRKGALIV
jgi:hypothetical protein